MEAETSAPHRIVIVTGGTGLVGHGIQEWLEERRRGCDGRGEDRYVFLSRKDGNLLSFEETRVIFERYRPTHVIHLAAKVGGLYANMNYKVEFFRYNMLINDNVMECCRLFGVKKLVSCLSTCIFPENVSYPFDETKLHDGPPHHSNEGYAYSKRMVDVLNHAYREEYGCNYTSIIPTNVYGKHDNFDLEFGHVIPALIHKCYIANRNREDFKVLGSGKPLRQFIYNVDLGGLIVWTLEEYDESDPLILSTREEDEVSISHVAHLVQSAFGFPGNLVFDKSKADGQFKKTASPKKLLSLRPDLSLTPMRVAIQETCDWFSQNFGTVARGTLKS
eukprot:472582_1